MKIHTPYDEHRIHRLEHQPHAVRNITLMSSICKLPKTIASSAVVVGTICSTIVSSIMDAKCEGIRSQSSRSSGGCLLRRGDHHHPHQQQQQQQRRRRRHRHHHQPHHHRHREPSQHQEHEHHHEHNSNQSTNCQHAHKQQTLPSHERIVVKPNFLATNLINIPMILLYITLFISIAVHPVAVNAVGEYNARYRIKVRTPPIRAHK